MRKNQTNKIQGVSKKYLSDYRQNASKLQQARSKKSNKQEQFLLHHCSQFYTNKIINQK